MTKWFLTAGVAALALSTPAMADRGGHDRNGARAERAHAVRAQRAERVREVRQARSERVREVRQARSERIRDVRRARADRVHEVRQARAERVRNMRAERLHNVRQARAERIREVRGDRRTALMDRRQRVLAHREDLRNYRRAEIANRRERILEHRADLRDIRRSEIVDRRYRLADLRANQYARAEASRDWVRDQRAYNGYRFAGYDDGCPPGLARKDNGCLPPGQANRYLGQRLAERYSNALLPAAYRSWYPDNTNYYYRTGGDVAYRVNRSNNLIDGLIPMFGDSSYYPVGYRYPTDYSVYNVPTQYQGYYPDNGDYMYRYGNNAIYQVDRSSGLVNGIAALLAGDLGVGQPLPAGYDVYNVPLGYRDQYADSATDWYRYNDGYIYQVDPTTRLVTAVINAIA